MGNVYRIVYDKRLTQEDLIDAMDKDDPPPIEEKDIPLQPQEETDGEEVTLSNHDSGGYEVELVEIEKIARWYAARCGEIMGQFKLVNPRAIEQATRVLKTMTPDEVRDKVNERLLECREARRPAPDHLGWLA